ncbi:MAG TPA: DUF5667 domain-containing protein [Candidatus Paceibacterota bacterium]|nr:DUF5667 domain-containing protein [Candidatus Paceibacterota bacterium]
MNEDFHTYIQKVGDEVSLTLEERAQMRSRIHSYMQMKPMRASASAATSWSANWFFSMRPVALTLVAAVFASSAGISYAAQNALPGDALYSIKTNINEPVAGALAVSSSAKAAWATNVAGTRVQEAATLAAEGRLSSSTEAMLQSNFDEHAQTAIAAIDEVASTSPSDGNEAAVSFEAQLSAYQQVLAQVGTVKDAPTAHLASAIQSKRDRIAAVRASVAQILASASSSSPAVGSVVAAAMGQAAKQQLDVSVQLAQDSSDALASSSAQSVDSEIASASTTISGGHIFLAKDASSDAMNAFQTALSAAEQIGVFLKTSAAIHAKTGLVIGVPTEGTGTASGERHRGSGQHVLMGHTAALMAQSTSSNSTMATSSSIEASSSAQIDAGDGNSQGDSHGSGDGGDSHILPLSMPTPTLP